MYCYTDAGFPNVRAAEVPEEVAALSARYESVQIDAAARGTIDELRVFEEAASQSKAVMNRSLGALSNWLNGASPLFLSYHRQVEVLGREPSDEDWDRNRVAAEGAINPHCYRDLNFAALTLDNRGATYYGPYSLTLAPVTIEERSTVFEENPFIFNERHGVIAGKAPPSGYRAGWSQRGRLAVAKLGNRVLAAGSDQSFADLLMSEDRNSAQCDFIEVHVFGPLHKVAIERIVGPAVADDIESLVLKQALEKAKSQGVVVEITP